MTNEGKLWWKGSAPAWVVAVLLGLIAAGGVRLLNEHDRVVSAVGFNTTRIATLEQAALFHEEALKDLKETNRGILAELAKLRAELRRQ